MSSKQALERWFERLYRLIPELHFEVRRISVTGWPWDMMVAVEWTDHGHAVDGVAYENEGAHWIRLQRGKATYIHAYLDTEKLTAICDRLAAAGVEEAASTTDQLKWVRPLAAMARMDPDGSRVGALQRDDYPVPAPCL